MDNRRQAKEWVVVFLFATVLLCILIMGMVFLIDPYFHYRKPSRHIYYELKYETYINNGILRHFDYDTVITGTSMCQNFKPSEVDDLFGTRSVKTCFQAASFAMINYNLTKAFCYNPNIKLVIRGVDYNKIDNEYIDDYSDEMPTYLYDDNFLNDFEYLLNMETIINMRGTIKATIKNHFRGGMTSFDDYSNWSSNSNYGIDLVREYQKSINDSQVSADTTLSDEDIERIQKNVRDNLVNIAREHPETEFYYFITPYSIFYWDDLNKRGLVERQLETEKIAIE